MKESGQNGKRWKQNKAKQNKKDAWSQKTQRGRVLKLQYPRLRFPREIEDIKSIDANLFGKSREEWKKQKARNLIVLVSSHWWNKHLPTRPWTHHFVTLGKSLHLWVPQFPHLQNGAICHLPTSQGWYEDWKDKAPDYYPKLLWGWKVRALESLGCKEFYKQHIQSKARKLISQMLLTCQFLSMKLSN